MLGKFILSLTAALAVSSGGFASVGHTQAFSIDAFNSAIRSGCVGSAEGGNVVVVGHAQNTYDVWHGTFARQQERATLIQNAGAVGSGGKDILTQRASVEGMQNQFGTRARVRVGRFGTWANGQTLAVDLETLASHSGGVGRARGAQRVVGAQSQKETTGYGVSASRQFVQASQFTAVSGGSYSTAKVNNSVDISLSQSH